MNKNSSTKNFDKEVFDHREESLLTNYSLSFSLSLSISYNHFSTRRLKGATDSSGFPSFFFFRFSFFRDVKSIPEPILTIEEVRCSSEWAIGLARSIHSSSRRREWPPAHKCPVSGVEELREKKKKKKKHEHPRTIGDARMKTIFQRNIVDIVGREGYVSFDEKWNDRRCLRRLLA